MSTFPCSVSLLTLNAAEGLPASLESLKDFAEIIVCDGNSTDRTREIAAEYGATIIKQYDTDEPNIPCAMDKAAVRERAMSASTLPWRFFMDADDTLSPEVVDEIRNIVTNSAPAHLVWRMPTRIFIGGSPSTFSGQRLFQANSRKNAENFDAQVEVDKKVLGKEILHEATYPSYQTRLVHKDVRARFKGPVHDHLVWDTKKFPVGTMKHYYNFHWSKERVQNYWKYTYTYIQRELQTMQFYTMGLKELWRWVIYFRARIFLGYVLWRLPAMYLRHGFRDSMPLSLELMIAWQHLYLLVASIGRYIASRSWVAYARRMVTDGRLEKARRDLALRDFEAYGRVLDIGGAPSETYWNYLQTARWHRVTYASTAELANLPPRHFDTVLCLHGGKTREAIRALASPFVRPGGSLIGAHEHVFREKID